MNLTKYDKQIIVTRVMTDVPRAYGADKLQEDCQKLIDANVRDHAPPPVAALWADKENTRYLAAGGTNIGYLGTESGWLCDVGSVRHLSTFGDEEVTAAFAADIQQCINKFVAENDRISEIHKQLTAAIAGVRTTKSFIATFPELEKYLPTEHKSCSTLPAIANVMAGLVTLGWPKDKDVLNLDA